MLLLRFEKDGENGLKSGVQIYKCNDCHRQFLSEQRLDNKVLWQEYTEGKQTYSQLALKYGVSIKTIQRRLDKVSVTQQFYKPDACVVLMDTNLFWSQPWSYGV